MENGLLVVSYVTATLIVGTDGERNTITLTDEVLAEWMPLLTWKMVPHTGRLSRD